MNTVRLVRFATFLLIAATFPARAAEGVTEEVELKDARSPWRGTRVTYGHAASAISFNKAAEPRYNPTWGHRLELRPEWHTGPLYLRGRFELAQELTTSDAFNTGNELAWSDFYFDLGGSWKEPFTGIRLGASLRLIAGLSKASLHDSRLSSVGPGVSLSRTFPVLEGLTVAYEARYTQRFHRYTTKQNHGPTLQACFDPSRPLECGPLSQDPVRNAWGDVSQTASVSFQPLAALGVSTYFQLGHQFLYDLPQSDREAQLEQPFEDTGIRYPWAFGVELGYDLPLPHGVNVAVGAVTASTQLGADSVRRSPFFNRYTQLYLNLGLDLEGLTASR